MKCSYFMDKGLKISFQLLQRLCSFDYQRSIHLTVQQRRVYTRKWIGNASLRSWKSSFHPKIKQPSKWIQNWYADDGSCFGPFHSLVEWLKIVQDEGPKHGYFNATSKNIALLLLNSKNKPRHFFRNLEFKC